MLSFFHKHPIASTVTEDNYNRLRLLENAVKNYSGGINSLIAKAGLISLQSDTLDPEVSEFIRDINDYLKSLSVFLDLH